MTKGPKRCLETSVRNYRHPLRNNHEERSSQLLRVGSLISRIICMNSDVTASVV